MDDGEDAALLDVQLLLALQVAEQGQWGIEAQRGLGKVREEDVVAVHPAQEGISRHLEQGDVAGNRFAVHGNRQIHHRQAIAVLAPLGQLARPFVDRVHPLGIGHHDVARAGRKAEADQGLTEVAHGIHQPGPLQTVAHQQRIVLVGLHDLLAAPFRAHHHQADVGTHVAGDDQIEQLGNDPPIHGGQQLHGEADLHPGRDQRPNQVGEPQRRLAQLLERVGALDPQADDVGVAGEVAEHIGQLDQPDQPVVFAHNHDALDLMLGHQDQRIEQVVFRVGGDQPVAGDFRDIGFQRHALEDHRIEQIRPGHHAMTTSLLRQQAV
ncbi:hypothetical protein D9M71_108370 [compost metagenome]